MWSSEPREGLAFCSAKGAPSFLSYVKTPSFGLVPGIEPPDLPLCSQHALPTELTPLLTIVQISPWKVVLFVKNMFIMKNLTNFRKTVETSVDLCLGSCLRK